MAFDLNKLSRAAPLANNQSLFTYVSPDSLATIAAAGYFNGAAAKVADGDLIIISGNEVSQTYTVTGNNGSTVTVSSGLTSGTVAAGIAADALGTGSVQRLVVDALSELRVSVKDYGAIGDGVAVDTPAFVLALASAKVARKPLYAPAGTYKITAELDCRSVGDNFAGIIGDGREKTKIVQYTANTPIIRTAGRYMTFRGFTAAYSTIQTPAQTAAYCLQLEDWVFLSTFEDLLLSGGHFGLGQKEGDDADQTAQFFSNSVRNLRCLNNYKGIYTGGVGGGTGNAWENIYISSPGRASIFTHFHRQNGFGDVINQLNLEQANIRHSALYLSGAGCVVNGLHMEGLTFCGNGTSDSESLTAAMLYTNMAGNLVVNGWTIDGNSVGPMFVASLTRSGTTATLTFQALGIQVEATGHPFRVGDSITLAGCADTAWHTTRTVASVSTTGLTFTCAGTETTPAVPASGADYITATLGTSTLITGGIIATTGRPENITVNGLKVRDMRVLGATSSVRDLMFRFAVDGQQSGYGSIRIKDLCTQGQMAMANWLGIRQPVAVSRASNIATMYFNRPHKLAVGDAFKTLALANSSWVDNKSVVTVVDPYTITYNNTGSDQLTPLAEATGYLIPVTLTVATRARANNVATLGFASAHGLSVGQRIRVANSSGTGYSDAETVILSVPTPTTFTYAATGSDEATTADTGACVLLFDAGLSLTAYVSPSSSQLIKELDGHMDGQACLSFGTVNAGATAASTVAHVGCFLGDKITFSARSAEFDAGLVVTARVSANGTITFTATNVTGSNIVATPTVTRYSVFRS